ncbi:MAG: AAA family ATPase [Blastomonas sp.]
MINPNEQPIDVQEQIDWINEHRITSGMSWNQLAVSTGIKSGTLSNFALGSYKGDNEKYARMIFRFRQNLSMQRELKVEAPDIPSYFETRTSREVINLLAWAQRGRMTVVACGPGVGKTTAAHHYRDSVSNVWMVTLLPSINTVIKLVMHVLEAMGDLHARPNRLVGAYVMNKLQHTRGLLIFDDAQHLSIEQVEEIRGWYDLTGVGVAFLGNDKVISRMEGGTRQAAFAQLYSRVGMRLIRNVPLMEDIEKLADEWRIQDSAILGLLKQIGKKPGGLRSCTFTLEVAQMIARSNQRELSIEDVSAAWSQLSTRPIAA